MAVENSIVRSMASKFAASKLLLSANADISAISNADIDALIAKLVEMNPEVSKGIVVVDNSMISAAMINLELEKAPMPIEINRSSEFKPLAAEIEADYRMEKRPIETTGGSGGVADFVTYFRSRLSKMRAIIDTHISMTGGALSNLGTLKDFTSGREVNLIGIVSRKITTKNGNILLEIEDDTDTAKIMFMNGTSKRSKELFENAGSIINDEVLAIHGKISGPFVIADQIIWPDVPVKTQKKTEEDIAIAFISDVHVGSRLFMDKNFSRMINWLNGNVESSQKALAGKIKYLVLAGDAADGIGVYPNQDKDLAISDMYMQYKLLFNFLESIPDYIHVFVLPGNHDSVQRAEPQPELPTSLVKDFKADNIHFLSNPSFFSLHGLNVAAYHGTSLDSIIASIPNNSYAKPEKAMVELLKRRHLSPIYGGNIIVPSKNDSMVIEKAPDILHMGHIHKNGITNYHGVSIVNSGTWQARTDFQVRQGHIPTPCIMPVLETKTSKFVSIDFNG